MTVEASYMRPYLEVAERKRDRECVCVKVSSNFADSLNHNPQVSSHRRTPFETYPNVARATATAFCTHR